MYLDSLLIANAAEKKITKTYKFNPKGLNVILGEKREGSESNGVGKTCMIEAIKYCLGSTIPKAFKNKPELAQNNILIALQINIDNKSICLCCNFNDSKGGYIINADLDIKSLSLYEKIDDDVKYRDNIEELLMPNKEKGMPSFASAREYIFRDEKSGFSDLTLLNRKAYSSYQILSYLSCLPWNFEKDVNLIKKEKETLQNELKVIEIIGSEIDSLKLRYNRVNKEIDSLKNILNNADICGKIKYDEDEYLKSKKDLSIISSEIFKFEYLKKQHEDNIKNLEAKVEQIKNTDEIKAFYLSIINYFPDKIVKNFEEITNFYSFMLDNRGQYFKEQIENIDKELETLYLTEEKLLIILSKSTELLKETDIIEDLNTINNQISEKETEIAEIRYKIGIYNRKPQIQSKINQTEKRLLLLVEKHEEAFKKHKEICKNISAYFQNMVLKSYGESGVLEYTYENSSKSNASTGRIKVKCIIDSENSHGRLFMKINMFDLSLLMNRVDNNADITFLFHDGSYSKPDYEPKAKLLSYVDGLFTSKKQGQYFITVNMNELDQDILRSFKAQGYVIAELLRSNDNNNRFFGFKF